MYPVASIWLLSLKIGMKRSQLADLNPELRRGFTPTYPSGYALNVPRSKAKRLMDKVVDLEKRKTRVYQPYIVRFGERLSDIAYRFQTTRSTLIALNNIPNQEPSAGLEIMVPRRVPRADRVSKLSVLKTLKFSSIIRIDSWPTSLCDAIYPWLRSLLSSTYPQGCSRCGTDSTPICRSTRHGLEGLLEKGFDRSRALLVNPSSLTKVEAGARCPSNPAVSSLISLRESDHQITHHQTGRQSPQNCTEI